MNKRIKKLRKELDLTQTVFAERIGMKQNSIALIESGKRNISDYALRVICREFNVNKDWLYTGEGNMFNPDPSSELDALAKRYGLTDGTRILIEKFAKLKPEHQDIVIKFILEAAEALKNNGYLSPIESTKVLDSTETISEKQVSNSNEDDDIEQQVAECRRQLELERRVKVKSSALLKDA